MHTHKTTKTLNSEYYRKMKSEEIGRDYSGDVEREKKERERRVIHRAHLHSNVILNYFTVCFIAENINVFVSVVN